ncbi:MAG: DUF1211 domain-containing protein [Armatimonadetes bacterium]|nr:DUF1211 domain-containing protein [Armatimonadota bacterium]
MSSFGYEGPDPTLRPDDRPPAGSGWLTKGRVENLADGVFSIVMTLLVLDLKVPELADRFTTEQSLWPSLVALYPRYASYLIGFFTIGIYWVSHHYIFHFVRRMDRNALWLNIAFMCCLSFLPFSTAVMGRYPGNRSAVEVYGMTLLINSFALLAIYGYSMGRRRLVDPNITKGQVKEGALRILFMPVTALIGMFTAIWNPTAGAVIYLTAAGTYMLPEGMDLFRPRPKRKNKTPSEMY